MFSLHIWFSHVHCPQLALQLQTCCYYKQRCLTYRGLFPDPVENLPEQLVSVIKTGLIAEKKRKQEAILHV